MRSFASIFFAVMLLSSGAAARMNADADMCEPGRAAAAAIDAQILMLSNIIKDAKEPGIGNLLLQRASLYRAKRDWRPMIDDLNRAESLFARIGYPKPRASGPGFPSPRAAMLSDRGAAYREVGEYERSLRDLDAALEDSPDYSHGYIERGVTNLRADRNDQAIEDFNHVIVNDFSSFFYDRARAYALRASAWLNKDKESYRADQDTGAAKAISYGACVEITDNFCWLAALSGRWLSDFGSETSLRSYWWGDVLQGSCSPEVSNRPNLLDSRALAYLQLGQFAEARENAEAAIRADPSDGEKHYMLGMVKEAAGDSSGAEIAFANAKSLAKPGDWGRWERQQGRFRKLPVLESLDRQAAKIVDESFKSLEKTYSYFRPDHRAMPNNTEFFDRLRETPEIKEFKEKQLRESAKDAFRPNVGRSLAVAVLAFEDNNDGTPSRCRADIVASVADNVARFNRAVGRTVFTMGTPERHDILFVFGGPLSVRDLKIDPPAQKILEAEERQTTEPNDVRFVSFAPPDSVPAEGANLHYRKSDGELLYANIARTWGNVSKGCSVDVVENLALAMTYANWLKLNWAGFSSSEHFNLPAKAQPVAQEIEACFLLQDTNATMDQHAECVRALAARRRDN